MVEFQRKNDDQFWDSITSSVVQDEPGRPLNHYGAIEDVAEIKVYVQRLVEEKCFSDSIIEAMPVLFWLTGYHPTGLKDR